MLTIRDVLREIAEATGYTPDALDHHVRYLRAAELAPMGAKGRGRHKVRFEPPHYANLLMSFAGLQLVDAPVAATHLRHAVHIRVNPSPDAEPDEDGNLGEVLEAMIRGVAAAIVAEKHGEWVEGARKSLPDEINLRLNPYVAKLIWWDRPGLPGKTLTYARTGRGEGPPTEPRRGALTRETTISGHLVQLCARLWATTLMEGTDLASVPPGGATAQADSETPEPRHRAPASLGKNQPREPKAGHSHSSENNSALVFTQARSDSRGHLMMGTPNDETRY